MERLSRHFYPFSSFRNSRQFLVLQTVFFFFRKTSSGVPDLSNVLYIQLLKSLTLPPLLDSPTKAMLSDIHISPSYTKNRTRSPKHRCLQRARNIRYIARTLGKARKKRFGVFKLSGNQSYRQWINYSWRFNLHRCVMIDLNSRPASKCILLKPGAVTLAWTYPMTKLPLGKWLGLSSLWVLNTLSNCGYTLTELPKGKKKLEPGLRLTSL